MQARWTFTLYPEAADGGGCFVPLYRREPDGGGAPDPERAGQEATRRARAKLRRYCAANRLNRFVTLTYAGAGCFDPQQLRADVAGFFRGLRRELGGKPLPYAWASEWHPGGHGLHVHFAVGRYVRQRLIRDVWGRGVVHVKLIGDLPAGSGTLEEARRAAGYLAKCVSKNIADERVPRLHGYEVAQGFQPERVSLSAESDLAVIAQASSGWAARPCPCGARRNRRAGAPRRRTGVPGLDDELSERAEKWAEETAVAQGLPPRIEDLDVLRDVCELLGLRRSGAPDGPQA